jgi:hypothetical protein
MRWFSLGLIVLLLAGCGGGEDSAADISKRRFELLSKGEFGKAWELLHPAHQQIVSKEAFVRCGEMLPEPPTPLQNIKILSTRDEQFEIPEVGTATVKRIELELRFSEADVRTPTDHIVKVDDSWRWVLTQEALDAYRSGGCPRTR